MISIELILPKENKRLCVRVGEKMSVKEFKCFLSRFYNVKYDKILMITSEKNVTDDMTLTEAGMYTGSGVIIDNGDS